MGSYAYVTGFDVLTVIDVSNPATPVDEGAVNLRHNGSSSW